MNKVSVVPLKEHGMSFKSFVPIREEAFVLIQPLIVLCKSCLRQGSECCMNADAGCLRK